MEILKLSPVKTVWSGPRNVTKTNQQWRISLCGNVCTQLPSPQYGHNLNFLLSAAAAGSLLKPSVW